MSLEKAQHTPNAHTSTGQSADTEALATLSPYQTDHINRFGNYSLNPNRIPEPLGQHLQLALA
jgi:hypothetical protein